jgi:hypothetical protein
LKLWIKLVPKVVIHGCWIAGSQQILVKSETGWAHYLAYLPLGAVRETATTAGWHCFGLPGNASLSSSIDGAEKASALLKLPWPWESSFELKQHRAEHQIVFKTKQE